MTLVIIIIIIIIINQSTDHDKYIYNATAIKQG